MEKVITIAKELERVKFCHLSKRQNFHKFGFLGTSEQGSRFAVAADALFE